MSRGERVAERQPTRVDHDSPMLKASRPLCLANQVSLTVFSYLRMAERVGFEPNKLVFKSVTCVNSIAGNAVVAGIPAAHCTDCTDG
jgi:hypothetical protein